MPSPSAHREPDRRRPALSERDVRRVAELMLSDEALMERLLDAYMKRVEEECPVGHLIHVDRLAVTLGCCRKTIYNTCERHGIPLRDKHGAPKRRGDRTAVFVNRKEWMMKRRLHGRALTN